MNSACCYRPLDALLVQRTENVELKEDKDGGNVQRRDERGEEL